MAFKYSNLGGYHENYDTKTADQKYQLPITINAATGAIEATAGVNYKQITQAQLTGGTGANNNFQYTTKGAAASAAKFHQEQEVHFEVALRRLCRIAKCKQMFPAGKKYFITLHKARVIPICLPRPSSTPKRNISTNRLYNRSTNCRASARKTRGGMKKIASEEGICYSLTNSYIRTYYVYPVDTVNHNYNVTNGYKPKYMFLYWVAGHTKVMET